MFSGCCPADILASDGDRAAQMLMGCTRQVPASMSAGWRPAEEAGMPRVFTGGWVGYCGYETVRYGYLGAQL